MHGNIFVFQSLERKQQNIWMPVETQEPMEYIMLYPVMVAFVSFKILLLEHYFRFLIFKLSWSTHLLHYTSLWCDCTRLVLHLLHYRYRHQLKNTLFLFLSSRHSVVSVQDLLLTAWSTWLTGCAGLIQLGTRLWSKSPKGCKNHLKLQLCFFFSNTKHISLDLDFVNKYTYGKRHDKTFLKVIIFFLLKEKKRNKAKKMNYMWWIQASYLSKAIREYRGESNIKILNRTNIVEKNEIIGFILRYR